jgi:hypothetical protein
MVRGLFFALFAAVLAAGCTTTPPPKNTLISTYVTAEGAARMLAADGIKEKWDTARRLCNEAGFATGTDTFLRCFRDYQAYDLRALRTRARAITDAVAKQYGLCIDRRRFEIARCTEI